MDQSVGGSRTIHVISRSGYEMCCEVLSQLGVEPSVACGLAPVDVQPASYVRQQLGQLHGVPGAAAAPHLLEGVGALFMSL